MGGTICRGKKKELLIWNIPLKRTQKGGEPTRKRKKIKEDFTWREKGPVKVKNN